ncbi:MAG TPA: peroxiredoxin family protein [Rubrobacter sp.]|nr:peroxiredoxin family protein [Rubrobacter sp.]
MANLSVGDVAPSFELPDQQDHPWSLSGQLEVSPVVLIFYRGDWCPYCNGQLAAYARKYNEFERRGTQPAAISVDPPVHNARMVGKLRIPFPLLSDPKGEVARAYGLWNERENVAVPAVVIIDRAGEVTYLHAGSDPADRPTDGEVFAVLKALKEPGVPGTRIERRTGGPELRTTAVEARNGSVRPAGRFTTPLLATRGIAPGLRAAGRPRGRPVRRRLGSLAGPKRREMLESDARR